MEEKLARIIGHLQFDGGLLIIDMPGQQIYQEVQYLIG